MEARGGEQRRDAGRAVTGGFWSRLQGLFMPGPFIWLAKAGPLRRRFHAGQHMHGLEEHDVSDRGARFRGTGIHDLPRDWSQDPPAR